jgi:hypothetical protein
VTSYAKRDNAFERGDHVWRVGPDALVWFRPDGSSVTTLWRDISAVRLAYAPTRFKPERHLIELRTRQGRRLIIDNIHFRGVGAFETRSQAYSAFARAVLDQVAAHAPDARAWLGASSAAYGMQLAAMVAGLGLAAVVLIGLPTPPGPLLLVKLALIALALPVAILWAVRARPRPAPLDPEVLARALP